MSPFAGESGAAFAERKSDARRSSGTVNSYNMKTYEMRTLVPRAWQSIDHRRRGGPCGVVERLKPLVADRADIEIGEDYWGGLRLMERMIGFDRAIVVDAIQLGALLGTIHLLSPDGVPTHAAPRPTT